MYGLQNVSHLNPEGISFTVFSKTELEKLCVKKIHSPLTFDDFGHPFPGGLYDIALGPFGDRSGPCGTCLKEYAHCPGHFGYIQLPLPVINTLFFRTIADVLKFNCFECFRLQAPPNFKVCLLMQVQLFDRGLVCDALNLNELCRQFWEDKKKKRDISEEIFNHLEPYRKLIEETSISSSASKNVETFRRKFITFQNLMSFMKRKNKICMYCDAALRPTKSLRNKIFVGDSIKTPESLKQYLRQLWANDSEFFKVMVPFLKDVDDEYPTDLMFFENIPVTPPSNRPVNYVNGRILENEQTQVYRDIIETTILLSHAVRVIQNNDDSTVLSEEAKRMYNLLEGESSIEKLNNLWELLQLRIEWLVDKPEALKTGGRGLKQLLEKKQGLIRKHMMGKRVNFSARTVITPDPYIGIEEIGIPLEFAKKVTIPVCVTQATAERLRTLIINGPDVHPGAVQVELEDGTVMRINPHSKVKREGIAKRLLTPHEKGFLLGMKIVHRHVENGDIALLNRQPTLHKPSIMAHTVRVLKDEKTLRLHYANCKPYNADFDGDEMNVHFPQNLVAQSEGYNLAKVPYQYLSVKDGSPLSGLIQDHVIAGVKLTARGQFFTKSEYHQLVCQGLLFKTTEVKLLPPTIIKPRHLWSGKQVLSTVIINNLPPNKKLFNMASKAKISAKSWVNGTPRKWLAGGTSFTNENEMSETEIVFRGGELLVGVLDKASFGTSSYGLIHQINELYGGDYSSKMLSSFSTLFTSYLQHIGFTISVLDILVSSDANKKRNKIERGTRKMGKELICAALDDFHDLDIKEIAKKVSEARFRNPKMSAIIDSQYKQVLDKRTNEINKICLPAGLKCSFPDNNLQLMVLSGSKGSTVNTMQISCLLGQVELEGKRPPLMISGKSLPCFPTYDFSPRAGGYIEGRFMTGIQPHELYYHSMAGREGLIDTTVKTSRSGYLQRCFIKLLEDVRVHYDMTVRDASGCVIQFLFGEDGFDVTKAQFLNAPYIQFLYDNSDLLFDETLSECEDKKDTKAIKKQLKEINEFREKFGTTLNKHRETSFKLFSEIAKKQARKKCSNPEKIDSKTGRSQLTLAILKMWSDFGEKDKIASRCMTCPDPVNSIMKPDLYPGSISDKLSETLRNCTSKYSKSAAKKFESIIRSKVMRSYCDPGEAVGVLAAQSLGEPCTQMTLNTFHFAGRGDMNVTLGIPRVREILMQASTCIKTPNMTIPFLDIPDIEIHAEKLRKRLTRVTVADVLVDVEVENELMIEPNRQWVYRLKFSFLPAELYKSKYNVKPKKILNYMKTTFCQILIKSISRTATVDTDSVVLSKKKEKINQNEDDEDEDPEEKEDEDDDQSENEGNADYSEEEGDDSNDEDEEGEVANGSDLRDEDEEHVEEERVTKNQVDFVYKYDKATHLWCSIEFSCNVSSKKVDLTEILRDLANKSVIFGTPNIKKAIVYKKDDVLTLATDGCNIPEMFKYHDILDLNKLVSNDIHKMAEIYGIEAATQVISKEVKDVFTPYSITVDKRHLSLVADFMTFTGSYTPLNRTGISDSTSPIQKISFESCLKFLKEVIIGGQADNIVNPSSCIMIGKPIKVGTGSFDLINCTMPMELD